MWLDRLDSWGLLARPSGSWVDAFGTGAILNRRHHGSTRAHELLWGWLVTHNDPSSGMWGHHLGPADGFDVGWLMPVNGFYRLTRGTYAQFGLPPPHPEAAIDTVLAHCRARTGSASGSATPATCSTSSTPSGCSAGRPTIVAPSCATRGRPAARRRLARLGRRRGLTVSQPGRTAVCRAPRCGSRSSTSPADLGGESDGLSWRPRGVHRLEPVLPGVNPAAAAG